MESLADNGNGSYAYMDDLEEARKLFVEDPTSILQVIVLDARSTSTRMWSLTTA
jgi:hypothetical protein